MARFVVSPHFRLQEWVAEEKGYFAAEGLDYEFQANWDGQDLGRTHATPNKVGAFQDIEKGRPANVSCACHWTVNVAASARHGKLYADCYSVAPSGIFVPPDSSVRTPQDLKGVPISVGYQSGSHYSTIQARRSSSTSRLRTSIFRSPTASCSAAWRSWSTAKCRQRRCSAARTISSSSSAFAR